MALQLVYPGTTVPLGKYYFDAPTGFNRNTGLKGGEVGSFVEVAVDQYPGSDGYDESLGGGESVLTAITLAHANAVAPYFLLDEGDAGYGTLFGSSFGAASTGAHSRYVHSWDGRNRDSYGPNTQSGSNKITAWPSGIFATDFYVITGLDAESPPLPGDLIFADIDNSTSKLTAVEGTNNSAVGYFVEFLTDRSLVSTTIGTVGAGADDPLPLMVLSFVGMPLAIHTSLT